MLMDIQSAARAQDNAKLAELLQAKQKLDKQLRTRRPQKKLHPNEQTI